MSELRKDVRYTVDKTLQCWQDKLVELVRHYKQPGDRVTETDIRALMAVAATTKGHETQMGEYLANFQLDAVKDQ